MSAAADLDHSGAWAEGAKAGGPPRQACRLRRMARRGRFELPTPRFVDSNYGRNLLTPCDKCFATFLGVSERPRGLQNTNHRTQLRNPRPRRKVGATLTPQPSAVPFRASACPRFQKCEKRKPLHHPA